MATCICENGWMGIGCEAPDCGVDPVCNGFGVCDGDNYSPPRCVNCTNDRMGKACEETCINGVENPLNSGFCLCDAVCYFKYADLYFL